MRHMIFFLLASILPAAAQAEWREATSKNFIIYSEGSEESLRAAATDLEKYNFVLRFVSNVLDRPASPIKLKVYMVPDRTAVQRTLPGSPAGIAGYYNAGSRGPFAVMPRKDDVSGDLLSARETLFHEYAHHFMFQYFPAAYPPWYSEGFAEYYGMTQLKEDNVVEVGHLAEHRFTSFRYGTWMPVPKLLTAKSYADVGENLHMLYAEGWLLVHYLAGDKERGAQLKKYLAALNAGKDFSVAANEAFGKDARQLDIDLRDYIRQHRLQTLILPFRKFDIGPIDVRTVGPAEQALLEHEITLDRGLLVREAKQYAAEVRAIAGRFPDDPYALSILTEAERGAGNRDAAAAAAARWLAVQPSSARAQMQKGALEIEALKASGATDKNAWKAARDLIFAAHKSAPRDPIILEAYYDSFTAESDAPPPAGAQNALYRAFELVPQAGGLRFKVAADFEKRGMIQDAIDVIKPLAYMLHGDDDDDPKKKAKREREAEKWREVGTTKQESAREMLARLEAKLAKSAAPPAKAN